MLSMPQGYKQPLDAEDIFGLAPDDKMEVVSKDFRAQWEEELEKPNGPSLVRGHSTHDKHSARSKQTHGTHGMAVCSMTNIDAGASSAKGLAAMPACKRCIVSDTDDLSLIFTLLSAGMGVLAHGVVAVPHGGAIQAAERRRAVRGPLLPQQAAGRDRSWRLAGKQH